MKKVLSTKTLDEGIIRHAQDLGLEIHCIDVIETKAVPFTDDKVLKSTYDSVAFTSSNAVKYFFENNRASGIIKNKKVFATSGLTASALLAKGVNATAFADNAGALAKVIIQNKEARSVLHICGNLALHVLENKLKYAGIGYQPLQVYETTLLSPQIHDTNYDALLFFSPSGVDSFFSANLPPKDILYVAIGNTTAISLKQRDNSLKVILPRHPSPESMIDVMAENFSAQEQ